ncbi:MAG: AI-2E family transporter [Hyphomicrobium sp.]|nr:AI-2E family transporter [Hyphomicrobium sp.]
MPMLADSVKNLASFLIVAAILVAALHYGEDILVPMALAVILAFLLAPIVRALRRANIPHSAAVTLTVVAAVTIAGAGVYTFSTQMLTLADNLDSYRYNLMNKVRWATHQSSGDNVLTRATEAVEKLQKDVMEEIGGKAASGRDAANAPPSPPEPLAARPVTASPEQHSPAARSEKLQSLRDFVAAIAAPAGKTALTILFAFFLLLQHSDLRDRIIRIAGTDNMSSATAAMAEAGTRLSTLFLTQAVLNASFGLLVGVALWFIGVPNAALWGVVAAIMRFVPFIGSFLAAVPPLLLAAGVEPGWSMFLATLALFVLGEPFMGHIVEPLVLGKTAGLSPFAIVLALSVWTILWGPIGLILAVPITLSAVVLGRYVPGLEFLSVLLGDEPALTPQQRFYNRLLSKDASAAIRQIEDANAHSSIAKTSDEIVLPALQLASADYDLDRLNDKQVCSMQETIDLIAAAFAGTGGLEATAVTPKQAPILVIPARGPIDRMAAHYLASLLNTMTPYQVTTSGAGAAGLTALSDVRASAQKGAIQPQIVIATTGQAASAQLKLIVKRAASYFPSSPIFVVGADANFAGPEMDSTPGHWMRIGQLIELINSKRQPSPGRIPDAPLLTRPTSLAAAT